MANAAQIDYPYYSPSSSTSELIELASTRHSGQISSELLSPGSNPSWHPKLTPYRLLVILSTVGLVAAKTATFYFNLTFASITLEWVLGVVVFLFFHLLGAYEETRNPRLSWLFDFDCMECFWTFLENFTCFHRWHYISDEIDTHQLAADIHPPLTGYRIIVIVVVATVGMTKSALLYGQEPKEATVVECVFGVGIVTGLYWLGLYEASSTEVYAKLFHIDYSYELLGVLMGVAVVLIHLFGFFFWIGASYTFCLAAKEIFLNTWDRTGPIIGTIMLILAGVASLMSLSIAMLGLGSICQSAWSYRAS